jgi:hypothetical protein
MDLCKTKNANATVKNNTRPFIRSIAFSFDSRFVNGKTPRLRIVFIKNRWGKYYRYGNISIIKIQINRNAVSLWQEISSVLEILKSSKILNSALDEEDIHIHEIIFDFKLEFAHPVFCKTSGFYKINDFKYRSNDFRRSKRKTDGTDESKGIQQSFVAVTFRKEETILSFCFSGKYTKHLYTPHLHYPMDNFINLLKKLSAVYITQATGPDRLIFERGYTPFLPSELSEILTDAHWRENFKTRYVTKNILRGAL